MKLGSKDRLYNCPNCGAEGILITGKGGHQVCKPCNSIIVCLDKLDEVKVIDSGDRIVDYTIGKSLYGIDWVKIPKEEILRTDWNDFNSLKFLAEKYPKSKEKIEAAQNEEDSCAYKIFEVIYGVGMVGSAFYFVPEYGWIKGLLAAWLFPFVLIYNYFFA